MSGWLAGLPGWALLLLGVAAGLLLAAGVMTGIDLAVRLRK